MADAEFTHECDRCSFETLVFLTGLETDPALRALGEIVHDLDIADARFERPETPGVSALALLQTWGTAARRHPVGGLGSIGEMLIEHNHGFGQGRGFNSECSFNHAHLPHDTWLQAPCLGLSFA